MKRFILKSVNVFLNIIIIFGVLISLFSLILQLLPSELSQPVLDWLNTNLETILPCGIATTITTVVFAVAKYSNTAINLALKNSEHLQSLQRKQLEDSYNERLDIAEQRDLSIVELINYNCELLKKVIEQNEHISDYERIVASKNISSSIIPDEFKDRFKDWLEHKEVEESAEAQIEVVNVVASDLEKENKNADNKRELLWRYYQKS